MTKRLFAWALALALIFTALPMVRAEEPEAYPVGEKIVYGQSGEGRELCAYRYGNGENVLILGFAIHGFEDNFARDGEALVETAQAVMNDLNNKPIAQGYGWSVYVLPCMNPDGLYSGYTNNGPGRCTTTYLRSDGTLATDTGIDLNRCFPTNFVPQYNSRNYTTGSPMAALEAKALDAFLKQVKGTGKNYLVDVHGWLEQTITSDPVLKKAFGTHFPGNIQTASGGDGYLISYAASLGYASALLELPENVYSMNGFRTSGIKEKVVASVEDIIFTGEAACGGLHLFEVTETPPTCTASGLRKNLCTMCGLGDVTVLPATGHSPDANAQTVTPATASRDGSVTAPCTVCAQTVLVQTLPRVFSDVKPDQYYSDALDYCYDRSIVSGTTANTFSPSQSCTRAQIVTFLWRALGKPEPAGSANPFGDVAADAYYYKAVLWAVENGITAGISADTFGPSQSCTRAQIVTFLYRTLAE